MLRSRDFPWMRVFPTSWVVNASTLGPIGLVKWAPGTWGSVAGVLWYALVFHHLPAPLFVILWLFTVYLAMAICDEAEKRLQQRDPGKIILDEAVAVPACFFLLAPQIEAYGGWPVLLGGFLLFRLFDIWKPGYVNRLQKIPGGVGVVMDDVAAALLALLVLHGVLFLVSM